MQPRRATRLAELQRYVEAARERARAARERRTAGKRAKA